MDEETQVAGVIVNDADDPEVAGVIINQATDDALALGQSDLQGCL